MTRRGAKSHRRNGNAPVPEAGPAAAANVVRAAGTVLWRYAGPDAEYVRTRRKREIAVIHRPGYDDWSLPKGKLTADETPPAAAARETVEETGYHVRLGRYLQSVSYPLRSGRVKRIDYWEAQALAGGFHRNPEVDDLRWRKFADAVELVTHDLDRAVLARFRARRAADSTVLLIRHARAGRRGDVDGPDADRPLDDKGIVQARGIVEQSLAFGPAAVHAADRLRCVDTVAPLAERLGATIHYEPALSEEAYARDPAAGRDRIRGIAAAAPVTVVCSQSGVIPDLVRWWSTTDGLSVPDTRTKKAATWVLSLRRGVLVAADRLPPPNADGP